MSIFFNPPAFPFLKKKLIGLIRFLFLARLLKNEQTAYFSLTRTKITTLKNFQLYCKQNLCYESTEWLVFSKSYFVYLTAPGNVESFIYSWIQRKSWAHPTHVVNNQICQQFFRPTKQSLFIPGKLFEPIHCK